jgi:hypothetical protein
MSELIKINWIAVVSGLLWITGLSLALAGFCRMEFLFLRHKKAMTLEDFRKDFFSKRLFLIFIVLIVVGGVLNLFKVPSENLLVTKLVNVDEAECINIMMEEKLAFLNKDLKLDPLNRKHKRNRSDIRDNTAVLFYDGYIKTPFIKFEAGYYVINFDARGSEAWEEFSILKIEFETLVPNHYLIAKSSIYIQLTSKMKPWSMGCQVEAPIIGRVKVSFVNDDLEPGGKRDRNAWIKDIKIWKRSMLEF